MIKDTISYFNNRIEVLGYFNEVLCLAEKIERNGAIYPAIYNNDNEYLPINLDPSGSLCYWRKGDITFSPQPNETGIGTQYNGKIPLKLVGFIKKESATNDAYFADNICLALIANLTVNNSALKAMLKAKKATLTAVKTVTDVRTVVSEEYDKVDFEIRYTHAYFSIDFELNFLTNSQCYADLCGNSIPDVIQIYNFCEDSIYNRLSNQQKICLTQRCTNTMTYQEISVVSGIIDSINKVFLLAHEALQVFKNGQLLTEIVDYVKTGSTITFIVSPLEDISDATNTDILSFYGNY